MNRTSRFTVAPDAVFADAVADFLAREALEFACSEYKLWIHRRGSLSLEPRLPWPLGFRAAAAFHDGGPGAPPLLSRLRRFVDELPGLIASVQVWPSFAPAHGPEEDDGGAETER